MPDPRRILDANFNRAREALRVMEDAARFILNDSTLSRDVKTLRHDLAAALKGVPGLVAHRDTPGDVGTAISTTSEVQRASAAEVVTAACKRLPEALRTIEEYAKLLPPPTTHDGPPLAASIEQMRYRGYALESRLDAALATGRARQWRVCVLLTEALCRHHAWLDVARLAIDGGADCIQLREKQLEGGEILRRAQSLVEVCRPRGVSVVINDRPDIALLAEADGLHLGQGDLPLDAARRLVGRQLLIGISTATIEQASAAVNAGADYCGCGPMFPTTTKDKPVIVGPPYLRDFVDQFPRIPHLAIAGITPDNLAALVAVGCKGVAVSSIVCGAQRPDAVVKEIVTTLQQR